MEACLKGASCAIHSFRVGGEPTRRFAEPGRRATRVPHPRVDGSMPVRGVMGYTFMLASRGANAQIRSARTKGYTGSTRGMPVWASYAIHPFSVGAGKRAVPGSGASRVPHPRARCRLAYRNSVLVLSKKS